MRGGRGGGRGGGRFGGRGNAIVEGRREAIEEFQLDAAEIDQAPPPLYPTNNLNFEALRQITAPLTKDEQYLVDKMRELASRARALPYYLSTGVAEPDIQRYSDKFRATTVNESITLFDCIHKSGDDIARYIPLELLKNDKDKITAGTREGKVLKTSSEDVLSRKRRADVDIDKLLEQEEKRTAVGVQPKEKAAAGEDVEEDDEGAGEEEEPEEDDDYGVDHYASDGEGYDSGGDEAYFD